MKLKTHNNQNITELKDDEIFVFGSNEAYIHGAGAAKRALKFGAQMGLGPFCGKTYGISTKGRLIETLSLERIGMHVNNFLVFARGNSDKQFIVTEIGTGLAGYSHKEIAKLFRNVPNNVVLPESFVD